MGTSQWSNNLTTTALTLEDLQRAFKMLGEERPYPPPEIVSPQEYEWRVAHPECGHLDYVVHLWGYKDLDDYWQKTKGDTGPTRP